MEKQNKISKLSQWTKWINTGLILTIGVMVWNASIRLKTLTFDSANQKQRAIALIERITEENIIKIVEHIQAPEIHMSMDTKDSLFVTEEEYKEFSREVMKSLNEMSVQIYVQGKLLRKIDDKLNK